MNMARLIAMLQYSRNRTFGLVVKTELFKDIPSIGISLFLAFFCKPRYEF